MSETVLAGWCRVAGDSAAAADSELASGQGHSVCLSVQVLVCFFFHHTFVKRVYYKCFILLKGVIDLPSVCLSL